MADADFSLPPPLPPLFRRCCYAAAAPCHDAVFASIQAGMAVEQV